MDKNLLEKLPKGVLIEALMHFGGEEITNLFHRLFYYSYEQTWRNTTWMDTQIFKCPFDLRVYQEIISELKPDLIIECGTATGGSGLYLAQICELLGSGKVVTIDIGTSGERYIQPGYKFRPEHPRVQYLTGSSTSTKIFEQVKSLAKQVSTVLVILDSSHAYDHVLEELRLYQEIVTNGSYMIVEDSNRNGQPVEPTRGAGSMEAIDQFLAETTQFVSDRKREKYFLTFNPKGYLKKLSNS